MSYESLKHEDTLSEPEKMANKPKTDGLWRLHHYFLLGMGVTTSELLNIPWREVLLNKKTRQDDQGDFMSSDSFAKDEECLGSAFSAAVGDRFQILLVRRQDDQAMEDVD